MGSFDDSDVASSGQSLRNDVATLVGAQEVRTNGPLFPNVHTLHVWVTQQLGGFESASWVHCQKFQQKLSALNASHIALREVVGTSGDHLIEVLRVCPFKREFATEHCVEEDACRPDICRRTLIVSSLHNFRTHIGRSTAEDSQLLVRSAMAAEPEINKLYMIALIYDNILQFDISMRHIFVVQVLQRHE
jgi:hypothetical protein